MLGVTVLKYGHTMAEMMVMATVMVENIATHISSEQKENGYHGYHAPLDQQFPTLAVLCHFL